MAHPILSAFRDLEIDPRDEARARAFGAALDGVAPRGLEELPAAEGEALRSLLRELVRSARARWDDALVVRILDEWLPREQALDVRVRLLVDRAVVTSSASLDEPRVVEAWQAALAMARKAGDAAIVSRAEEALAERKERKATWSKRVDAFRAAAATEDGTAKARALAAAAEEALRFGKAGGRKKSQGLVEANAEAELERAFDLDPSSESAARLLANVFDARRRLDDRTRVMRRHAASLPAEAAGEGAVRVAFALCRERKLDEALASFQAAGALTSSDVLALDRFAACAIAVDDPDATTAALSALAERGTAFPLLVVDALAGLLHVLVARRGRRDLAAPFADALRAQAPDHEALELFERAPQADVTTPLASEPQGEAEPAAIPAPAPDREAPVAEPLSPKDLEALRVRLRRDPADVDARARLKGHYRLQGPAAALVELLRYELAQGRNAEERRAALVELCAAHRTLARNDAALIGTLSQLVALEPLDRDAAHELAELLEKHGRWRDALVVLGKLAESETEPARKLTATRALARRWSAQMAQAPQVAEAWERVLALDPGDPEAFGALREILTKRHAHGPLAALLEARAAHASSDADRQALLLEAAKLFAERLGRAEDAIAHLRRVLADNPSHVGAIEALERIADARRDYALLAEAMEARLAFTQDENLQITALQRLAALYAERLQDPVRALATWRRVLQLSPTHSRAARAVRDALIASGDIDELERTYAASGDFDGFVSTLVAASEREADPARRYDLVDRAARVLAGQHPTGEAVVRLYEKLLALDPKRLAPARRLVEMHEAEKRFGRLGGLYELLLADESSVEGREAWLGKLVELYLERVPDAARAWRFAVERFEASAVEAPSIEQIETVAKRTGRWGEVAAVLGAARGRAPAMDAALRAKIATIQARELGAVDDAVATLESLWADGEDVFRDLERLLRAHGRVDALRAAYERRIAQLDEAAALALSSELALLEEEVFGDPLRAAAAHRAIVARAPEHVPSLRALVRFAEALGDAAEADARLGALIAVVPEAERAALRLRRAKLLAAKADGLAPAWDEVRAALDEGLDGAEAAPVLESLTACAPVRGAVLGRLARVYEEGDRPAEASAALERLADCTEDRSARAEVVARRAEIVFTALEDRPLAVALSEGLVREDPARSACWSALRRYDGDASRASGPYVRAARAALEADASALPRALRVELAAHVAEALDTEGRVDDAFGLWLVAIEGDASHDRARDRGLAACMREGAGADRVDRFFRAAYGEAAGERTLANWASALRIQGAHAAAADRLAARLELVGASDEAFSELADCLEAAGLYARLVEVLAAHAAATASEETRARQTQRRIAVLLDRIGDRARACVDALDALGRFPGDAGVEALAGRIVDGAGDARTPLVRALAASAERAGRLGDAADWLERLASAEDDPAAREAALRRCLAIEVVREDDVRAERLLRAAAALAPGDETLREGWIEVLRRLGRSVEFVDAMLDAFAREPSAATRSGVLRAADLASSVLDDAARACALFARVRDDAGADPAVRADASRRGLVVARLALPREALLGALDAHLALALDDGERGTVLEEAARVCDALGLPEETLLERWGRVVAADDAHIVARARLADVAESAGRFERAVAELDALAIRTEDLDDRVAIVLRSARIALERLAKPGECLAALDALDGLGAARRDVQELRLAAARRVGRDEAAGAALRALVTMEPDASARAKLRVDLASILARSDEGALEALEVAEAALDDDPSNVGGAEVLRSLLDVAVARARAAESLIARFGRDASAPALLVVALEARAACSVDGDEAAGHLMHAARVAEDVLGDGAKAFDLALASLARVTDGSVRRVAEEAVRLARALDRGPELVRALDARVTATDEPRASAETVDVALTVGERLGATPQTMLAWLDASIALVGAQADRLEQRLVYARAAGDPERVLEALDRLEPLRVSVDDRFDAERERIEALDAVGRGDAAIEAGFRALALRVERSLVTAMRARLAVGPRVDDALRLEEIVREDGGASVELRVESLLVSIAIASGVSKDVARACGYLEEALALAPNDASVGAAATGLLAIASAEDPAVRASAARALERSALARGDYEAVVEAREALVAIDRDDVALLEALAEARLTRGDRPEAVAPLWVEVVCRAPGHRRAFGAIASLEAPEARLKAAEALAAWLDAQSFDDDETAALCDWVALELVAAERRDRARPFLLRAYRANPTERAARFGLLDELLAEGSETPTRVELHRERAQETLDVATRFERLLTLADLEEQRDGHARTARATYEEALEIGDFDLAAVAALERVYAAEEDWRALVDLLARRLERTPSASDRARIRARQATVALEKLGACDEALDVVLAWLEDTRDDHRARHDALGWVERLLANERVRGRVAVECEPLLGAADGAARARVLEVAAELEPTRADAARWWLARVRHGLEAGDGLASASVDALARAFSGDPTSAELRALAGQVAARGVDWSEIARACEATIADLEPWERRDAVLALVAVLDEDAGDARGALALLDAATAEPDADDALHVKADELSMIVADWRRNVRALQRRAAATLDGEVRIDCLRRASSVAEEELEDRALALALAQELLVDGEQVDDLARAARLARAVPDGGALRRLLPRLLDARAWSGEDAEGEALELVDAMLGAGEAAEGVLEVIGRALDAGLPRPRLAAKLLEVLRASARHEDLASALEVEAERAVDPTAAAAAWDERSIVCGRALGDADAAFEAARRACDAAPSEARFARLVDTARHDARLLEDAIAFVESASGPGRDAAEWALLDAALGSFEGDARLAVARRLGAAAWSAGRAAKAAEAWLVALELDPAEDPFEESLEERIAAFGPEFLPRYAEVLGAVEREALDPGVAASAALRRGALLVERMDRRADALPSLRHAERADVDPPRVARLVVRALESGAPSKEFAEALDRATAVADGAERAALALRAARAWAGVEAPTGVVLERVEAAIEASDDACAQAEDLLVASLDDGDCFARAAERLEALYRARGDRAGRIALKRKAVAFAEHASDRLRALVELARTIDDLDGAPEDSLGAIVDAASIDAFDDDVFAAFVDVLGRRPSTEVALPRIVAALRAQEDGRAGWVRYALVLAERGSLPLPPRAELLRAAVSADPESAEALAALEAALVLEAPGAELVAVLMRRAQVELDPEPRATFLRRALAIATETLADAALAETVLAGWAEIDEGPELFACRVAEADRTGNAEAGLAWSRRAAEEAFDPDAQTALWRAHLDRAERLGAWGETLSALERLLAVDPADGSLQTRQRAALRASGDLDGLARAYEDHAMTAEDEGRRVVLTLELAELCERSTNDLARAREALRRAVDGGAREEEALDAARAFAARNRDDAWFVEVLEAASDAAVARGASARAVACLTEAASLLEGPLGDASGALERLERARAIAPAGDGLASHLVRIARHLERWELAIDVLEERVARDPSRGSFADLVATADASREGWLLDRALDVWRRLSFDAADLEDALYRALVREERVDEAHAFLRERTERLRGAGRAREAATLVRDALGATGDERPLGLLELAVQVDPEDVDASFELAVRFAEDGRGDDARAVLEAALPTLHAAERIAHAHLLLGRIARDQWDLDRARRHLTKAHGAAPDWSLALRELAAAAQEAGDVGEAFTHWKALLLLPLDESGDVRRSDALVGLARLYEDEGERAKASELYAHALAAAPDHEEAARGAARTR